MESHSTSHSQGDYQSGLDFLSPTVAQEQPSLLPKKARLTPDEYAQKIRDVAYPIAIRLQGTSPVSKKFIRSLMDEEFEGTNSQGAWKRKDSYEAGELAMVMLLHSAARMLGSKSPQQVLDYLRLKQEQLPTQTVRSEAQLQFQQFSTPLPLAFIAMRAAQVTKNDVFLEPSAGTGLIAAMAKLNGATVCVNELAANRAAILRRIFPKGLVFTEDAARIDDILPYGIIPSVVIANPPFSRSQGKSKNDRQAVLNHFEAAFSRLAPGGRMVLISGENFKGSAPTWKKDFERIQQSATIVFSSGVDGRAFYKHGTTFETRLTVFDKTPSVDIGDMSVFSDGLLQSTQLLEAVLELPKRLPAPLAKLVLTLPTSISTTVLARPVAGT